MASLARVPLAARQLLGFHKMQSLAKFLASPQTLQLGEVNSTGKSRIANLSGKGGKPIRILLAKECTLPT